ncbi:polymer-forming cytoskeletal protein [uncultured Algimonas sp.]|uniref:bactofilin family protein n=1 Tax=uncultured Algimonas sp. TaxID=1547920 RepID=UPI002609824A|nr:polymer-forming cytoskeletal protein [uncultured Algimonas sp.]
MFTKSSGGSSSQSDSIPPRKASTAPGQNRAASVPSLLSQDLLITGDIKTDGEVQIDGRLDGNISAGKVTIGEHGAVNGKIVSTVVLVRGKVTGKIDATSIELAETANVQADLVQDKLVVANGAFLDGKCNRKSAAPTPIKAAEPVKAAAKKSA